MTQNEIIESCREGFYDRMSGVEDDYDEEECDDEIDDRLFLELIKKSNEENEVAK